MSEMNRPRVVSRDEWLEARKALLIKEKELTRAKDAVAAQRRALPMVKIDKEYVFEGPEGKVGLLGLFEGRRQLIVYHFMWRYDIDAGCPSCSFVVDNMGHLAHLHAANTTLVLVSRAPFEKLATFKERMGWTVPWYSSYGNDFNYDFHVTLDPQVAPVEYNFRTQEELGEQANLWIGEAPGLSVFLRDDDTVYHTYSTYARGLDILLGTFNYLDRTPLGRQEEAGIMNWIRHHDRYST
ncbi:DUF899 domain-containing protein [Actinopolymorpha alba]|uniref:DUF899 domain-containing protein n=1 Tax=Actinopolymorpha alba TaxID=533267 RepID=UPI00037DF7C4|nr:DUF899 domain-containing protein [Actinopolymorpha alba]